MDLPSPSRRALTLVATATVGSLAAVPLLDRLSDDGRPSDDPSTRPGTDPRASLAGAQDGLRLAPETGGVRATDLDLATLGDAAAGARARRSTGSSGTTDLDTGRLDTDTFSMLGVTWQGGAATVLMRARAAGTEQWTSWTPVHALSDGPDRGSDEGVPGLNATEATWVGASDGLQVRVVGEALSDLRLSLIQPEPDAVVYRAAPRPRTSRLQPRYRTRGDWGADDSLRNGRAEYIDTIRQVHVHHTVSSNDYSAGDVPGLIRGMYRYHTRSLGWSDIGYNFLVDRFGRIWVGRAGGPAKAVRGAHTLGFNHCSTGVSVIGNFETAKPNRKIIKAISRVAAWKLHQYGRSPRGYTWVRSEGSDRYAYGQRVRLHVIDGHRDTNDTACPGTYLYNRLYWVRRKTQLRMNKKLAR